jgi:hypothetical protein
MDTCIHNHSWNQKGYQNYTNENCKNTKQINHGKDMYMYELRYHADPVIYML